ncbi:MAG: hypothetical protein NC397_10445, partial [Clostridium sp.]|nr:hypothetical protein [Clostridium sp.]
MTSSKAYAYTEGDVNHSALKDSESAEYTYENSIWLDSISNINIEDEQLNYEYDANGNPTNLRIEDIDALKYEWTNGRQLSAIYCQDGDELIKLAEYTYDENGLRTSVTANGNTTYFIWDNETLVAQYQLNEKDNTPCSVMMFIYDNSGEIIGVTYDNRPYFYQKNTQGDVIGVVDHNGAFKESYYYDAWGHNFTGVASGLNFENPIKYRGYYYDSYSGTYYLQSRYYNDATCRFINLDSPSIA